MKHNSATLSTNIRTASAKPCKNGGQKANWLRQMAAARKVEPCKIYTMQEIAIINTGM